MNTGDGEPRMTTCTSGYSTAVLVWNGLTTNSQSKLLFRLSVVLNRSDAEDHCNTRALRARGFSVKLIDSGRVELVIFHFFCLEVACLCKGSLFSFCVIDVHVDKILSFKLAASKSQHCVSSLVLSSGDYCVDHLTKALS